MRLAIFDVDGVLTDGSLWFGPGGEAFKRFDAHDGHGVKMLQAAGVATAILSGRDSLAVARRAEELGIGHVIQGAADKLGEFSRLRSALGVEERECAFVGDDLPDLPVMRRCGLAVAVAGAVEPVRSAAHYVTRAAGGCGAVREFCDLVLAAKA